MEASASVLSARLARCLVASPANALNVALGDLLQRKAACAQIVPAGDLQMARKCKPSAKTAQLVTMRQQDLQLVWNANPESHRQANLHTAQIVRQAE